MTVYIRLTAGELKKMKADKKRLIKLGNALADVVRSEYEMSSGDVHNEDYNNWIKNLKEMEAEDD
jgi:hypothetical protein